MSWWVLLAFHTGDEGTLECACGCNLKETFTRAQTGDCLGGEHKRISTGGDVDGR